MRGVQRFSAWHSTVVGQKWLICRGFWMLRTSQAKAKGVLAVTQVAGFSTNDIGKTIYAFSIGGQPIPESVLGKLKERAVQLPDDDIKKESRNWPIGFEPLRRLPRARPLPAGRAERGLPRCAGSCRKGTVSCAAPSAGVNTVCGPSRRT